MEALYSVSLTLRRVLGFFVPGFAWLFIAYLAFDRSLSLFVVPLLQSPVLLPIIVLFLSYIIGSLNIEIAFRISRIVGDTIDLVTCSLASRSRSFRAAVGVVSRSLHILDLTPLEQERQEKCPLSETERAEYRPYATLTDICKMRLIADSPRLAQSTLDVEADINYYAGMSLPIMVFSIELVGKYQLAGVLMLLLALWHALRFQHLRHHEINVVYLAYKAFLHSRVGLERMDR